MFPGSEAQAEKVAHMVMVHRIEQCYLASGALATVPITATALDPHTRTPALQPTRGFCPAPPHTARNPRATSPHKLIFRCPVTPEFLIQSKLASRATWYLLCLCLPQMEAPIPAGG